MSIVNFKNNPFNNSDYSDAEKNGDVNSINPLRDGEPRTAEILNRPSNFDWGRTEILKESIEALWAELLVRKFSVEAIARGWSGYYYNNDGTPTFVPGRILIPANTSLKIIGYALPQWGSLSGSDEYFQHPVIGICFNKSLKDANNKPNPAFATIRFKAKNESDDIRLEEYRASASSDKIKCGHEIILKIVTSSSQSDNIVVTADVKDKYAIFTLSLKDGINVTPQMIKDALLADTSPSKKYIADVTIGNSNYEVNASSLVGTIKSGETIASYDSIPDTDASVRFYNRAPVSKYEIDIPASVLSAFFADKTMSPGDVLFVSIPQNTNIPRDGSILREVQNRQHIGQYLATKNDLLIYSKNSYNVTKFSPTNHLLIPIVRINAPYSDNYNQIDLTKEFLVNKLFYAEFIDGVKVYPGKWHYDINEEDEGSSSPKIYQCSLTTDRIQNLSLSNIGDGCIIGNSCIQLSNKNCYFEGKDYLLIRGVDPANNKVILIKTNSELEVTDNNAYLECAKTLEFNDEGLVIAVHSQKVSNPKTIDVGTSDKFPHWNDGFSITSILTNFEEHRQVGTVCGHKPNTVSGAAIKDHEITPVKISNDTQAEWSFPGKSFDAHTEISERFPNPTHLLGNFYVDTDQADALARFSIALGGNITLGSKTTSMSPVPAGLSIMFTAGTGVTTPGYVVYYNSTTEQIEPVTSTNFKDTIGIILKAGTYCHILIYGICYCRKITTGSGNSIPKGKKIVISGTDGTEGLVMAKPDSGVTYSLGMALETAGANDLWVKVLFWGYRSEP